MPRRRGGRCVAAAVSRMCESCMDPSIRSLWCSVVCLCCGIGAPVHPEATGTVAALAALTIV